MRKIVLLRHGESLWNQENRFTGWTDIPLTHKGQREATLAAQLIKKSGIQIDATFTSVLVRTIHSLWLVLDELGKQWLPVDRSWRLNERHYGALQGLNKDLAAQQLGEEQVHAWRKSFRAIPPLLKDEPNRLHLDARYKHVALSDLPMGESLEMTIRRMLPYWQHAVIPRIRSGETLLLVGHGNTLRALMMYLGRLDENAVMHLHVPTGIPIIYTMEDNMDVVRHQLLE
ncbi:2,3-diphosphoglycerate-dependent phosphoglycerate mutase [Hafnia psychrotolerans]|uniref:2,3-bisphosphoglycerate-dependent phosphoglycerate mutase n=1 Tax=Hafnia psychrotolerans TaxID=1477018 RepID=A0ABQ1GIY8_9GAMM|nr:2,3-diphosphoglycerate-dependent phosphoglycerate mutase [Hafnia psychrotolerans]GGA44745.1 2,3-bisphosphoglycerate-dependent phosphoglycerate mutase [Hafnia psychrotolerans]